MRIRVLGSFVGFMDLVRVGEGSGTSVAHPHLLLVSKLGDRKGVARTCPTINEPTVSAVMLLPMKKKKKKIRSDKEKQTRRRIMVNWERQP